MKLPYVGQYRSVNTQKEAKHGLDLFFRSVLRSRGEYGIVSTALVICDVVHLFLDFLWVSISRPLGRSPTSGRQSRYHAYREGLVLRIRTQSGRFPLSNLCVRGPAWHPRES